MTTYFQHVKPKLALSLLVALILLAGCGRISEPPSLTAERLDGQRLPMTLGSYNTEEVQSDSAGPAELVRDQEVHPFQPKAGIVLDFDGEDAFQIEADLISMENPQAGPIRMSVKNQTLTLPEEPGYYALHVQSKWKNASRATYALSIQIEER